MAVQGMADVRIIADPDEVREKQSPAGKPFLRLKFDNGVTIDITTNLAEMIGGVGTGTRLRYEVAPDGKRH